MWLFLRKLIKIPNMQVTEVKFDALAFHEYANNGYILPVAL